MLKLIAGIDEAGCGALAGPVVAAVVILNHKKKINGLADSKILSTKKLSELSIIIKAHSIAWAIGYANEKEIDEINILQAKLLAMNRALNILPIVPDHVLVDGNFIPYSKYSISSVVNGDSFVPEISAASIIAKVARDYLMTFYDSIYQGYGFAKHKGYGTSEHISIIKKLGITNIHRCSFAPIKTLSNIKLI